MTEKCGCCTYTRIRTLIHSSDDLEKIRRKHARDLDEEQTEVNNDEKRKN